MLGTPTFPITAKKRRPGALVARRAGGGRGGEGRGEFEDGGAPLARGQVAGSPGVSATVGASLVYQYARHMGVDAHLTCDLDHTPTP
jgi:hypothetical protein